MQPLAFRMQEFRYLLIIFLHFLQYCTPIPHMRFLKFSLLGFLLLVITGTTQKVDATHLMGVDITYECISACVIRVYHRVYRDCGGASGVSLQSFAFTAPSAGCFLPTPQGNWVPGSGANDWFITEVTPVCPGTVTQCTNAGSVIRGVEEYYRYRDYNICGLNCTTYNIEWWGQNRNGGITSGAANQGLGSFTTTLNLALQPCNSSPQFTSVPTPYVCEGQPFTFNQGAFDPDGDSLSYSFGPCFDESNTQVNYNAGYTPTAPLGPSWQVTINPVNGDVSFIPQPGLIEVGVMCVYVSEWRNGVVINTVVRDIQVNVIPCPANFLPTVPGVSNIANGAGQGGSAGGVVVGTCVGSNLCFDLPVNDANLQDSVFIWWDQTIPGLTFQETGNPAQSDTIAGNNPSVTVCWTPNTAGVFSFLVNMQDNACPNFGFNQFTVTIVVSNPAVVPIIQPPRCDTLDLCAVAINGIPPYTFQWTGQGGLSSSDSCLTHIYPGPGTYGYDVTITDSVGCTFTFSDSVTISQIPTPDAGPDILACENYNDTIGSPPATDEVYSWDPITGLSDPTVSNPVLTLNNPGPGQLIIQYILTATDTMNNCVSTDTLNVQLSYPAAVSSVVTDVTCYSGNDGEIDLTVTDGLAPLVVSWSGPNGFTSASQDINNLFSGTYILQIVDAAGCITLDTVEVNQPPGPVWVNAIPTDVSCNGGFDGSIDVTVTGGFEPYTFSWSTTDVTEDISNLSASNYTVTVTDSNGCMIVETVTIGEPSPVVFSFNVYDVACAGGSSGIIAASATGGNGNYSYFWPQLGNTSDSVSNLQAGTYVLEITDTSYSTSNVSLFFDDFDGFSPWILNIPSGTNDANPNLWNIDDDEGGILPPGCAAINNGDNTLHITSGSNQAGGAVYDFTAETNLRAESPFISTVGFSNLTLSFDFTSLGDALLDNASVVYNDGSGWQVLVASIKSLTCAPAQGQWSNFTAPLPPSCDNIPNLQVGFNWSNNADAAGNFPSVALNNVQVTSPVTPIETICSWLDSATVNEPLPLTIALTDTDNPCFGDSLGGILATVGGGNGNYGYSWSNSASGQVIGNLPAGLYEVTVTDTHYTPAGGALGYLTCTITDTVSINDPPPLGVTATATPTSCFLGSDGTVTGTPTGGTPGYSYVWSTVPTQITQTAIGLPTGSYQVVLTDSNGCTDTTSTVVSQPPPVSGIMSSVNATCGDANGTASVQASGGVGGFTYAWSTTPTQNGQTATGLLPGTYVVTITDANGCQGTGSIAVGNEPNPDVTVQSVTDNVCFGESNGEATVVGSGGTPPYNFFWSNSQTGTTAINLANGTYTVTIQDDFGCEDTVSVTIGSPPELTGTTIVQNMGCMSTVGDGAVGVIPVGGTSGYTYLWSTIPAQTTQQATNLDPGVYSVTVTDANGCTFETQDTVIQIPRPDVTAGPNASFCEGEGGAQIFATATGGSLPYYWSWYCDSTNTFCGLDTVNDDDPIANPDTSTWYYIYVVDFNGCLSDTDSVFVTELPKPIVDAGEDIVMCGDSAPCEILNPIVGGASGPYNYAWSPLAGLNDSTIANPCARPDTTTIYTLIVTAGNGCTSELTTIDTNATVTVVVNPVPVADAGPDRDICFGDSTMLQGIGSGAGPLYEFQWSPGSSLSDSTVQTPFAFPTLNTEYVLVVYSNGCPSYGDTVSVDVHQIPTSLVNWDDEICLGDTGLMDGIASGDSIWTYEWLPPLGIISSDTTEDIIVSPDTTTTYQFIATTQWGCSADTADATIYVLPTPIADAGPNQEMCDGDTIQLQGSHFYTTTPPGNQTQVYYSWNPAANMDDSTLAAPTVWPTSSGWYVLDVRQGLCSTDDSTFVTVYPMPGATVDSDTSIICGGDSVQLYSTGGLGNASFTWLPPVGLSDPTSPNPQASPDSSVVYTLIVEENGCADTLNLPVDVIPNPEPSYLSSLTEGCVPHSVHFLQNSDHTINYIWDFGDGSPVSNEEFPVHVYTEPGDYIVTMTAVNTGGCSATFSDTVITVRDTIGAEFTSNPLYPVEMYLPDTEVDFTSLAPEAPNHVWDFGDGFTSGQINPVHEYQDPGTYMVQLQLENEFGCISRITHGPYIVMTPGLFIPNVFSPNNDGINDRFLVEYSGSQATTIQIFDRWGVKLYESNNKTQGWNGLNLDGEAVPEGVYFYRVKIRSKEYAGEVTLVR